MGDSSSISTILEFLKKNGFTKAEAALRSEMTNQPDVNGFRRIHHEEEEDEGGDSVEEQNAEAELINSKESGPRHGGKVSKELMVKEIECGSTQNSLSSKCKSFSFTTEHNAVPEALGPSDNSFIFSIGSEDTVLELQSRKFNPSNGPIDSSRVGSCVVNSGVLQIENSEQLKLHIDKKVSTDKVDVKSAEGMGSNGDKRASWVGSTSKANVPPKFERNDKHEVSDIDQRKIHSVSVTETDLADDLWWRNNDVPSSSSEQWKEKECLVKTVFPFPKMDVPAYDDYEDAISISEKKEGKRKTEAAGIKAAIKEKVYEENLDVRSGPVKIEWFKGGITNNCYNCLDRNIAAGNGSKVALYWEGNDPGFDGSLTYNQLLEKVCQLANYLKDIGVKKGDAVVIYLPMLMELPIAMLACARIGAVHSVVFAGFSAESLAQRIVDCKPKVVLTCNAVRRGSKVICLKDIADAALVDSAKNGVYVDVCLTYVNQSVMNRESTKWHEGRDVWWQDVVPKYPTACDIEWVDAEDPLFLLYTSGSTGNICICYVGGWCALQ